MPTVQVAAPERSDDLLLDDAGSCSSRAKTKGAIMLGIRV